MLSLTLKKSVSAGSVPDPTLDEVDRYLDTQRGLVKQKVGKDCGACNETRRCIHCVRNPHHDTPGYIFTLTFSHLPPTPKHTKKTKNKKLACVNLLPTMLTTTNMPRPCTCAPPSSPQPPAMLVGFEHRPSWNRTTQRCCR